MKLVYKDMGHILSFDEGYVNELVVENKKLFFEIVNSIAAQVDGGHGDCVLSIKDRPVELGKYADLTVQFAPFELNRKSLLTKLYSSLEHKAFDRDRLFIMVNMRSYFDHSEMEAFTESANLHGFRVLLLESTSQSQLKNTQRYTIDEDLCEF